MYGCERWTIKKAECHKNWCFSIMVLEKTLERVPWTARRSNQSIQPVNPKGNQSWTFNARIDADAEAPMLCPPDVKNWLTGKDPDAGKDWRQKEKGATEDEMVDGITYSMDVSLSRLRGWWWTGKPGVLQPMGPQRVRHNWVTELNWTELKNLKRSFWMSCNRILKAMYMWIISYLVLFLHMHFNFPSFCTSSTLMVGKYVKRFW